MGIPAKVLAKMATIGLSPEQAEAVAQMLADVELATKSEADAQMEAARAKGRERWHRWDEKRKTNVSKREQTAANNSRERVTRVEDKTSNLEIEPHNQERNALTREFDEVWSEYPNKVGKPKAKAAFIAARKRASFADILDGLHRYMASKPADRAWLNPATFFNQDRWADQPANVVPMARGSPRHVDNLINSLLTDMDQADAIAPTEIEGYPAPPRRLSGY